VWPPAPTPRKPRWWLIGLGVVLVGALAVGAVVFVNRGSHGPSHPAQWDDRVADLAKFAERHRGLKFKHPVTVDFLSDDEYGQRARSDPNELTDEDKKQLQNEEGELRALGLMKGEVDLFAAGNDLADAGTAAFYDPDTQRVSVRGTDMTVELKVTLVHELTHALQDQYFDISSKRDESFQTSGESEAFRALVEGDAVRIEDEYIDSLSKADQQTYFNSNSASVEKSQDQLTDVPTALQALMAAPYIYGPPFASILDADGGQHEVDDAFKKPPVDDEQAIDPRQFLDHSDPLEVDKPPLPDGVKDETDSGDFGAIGWYLMLAERIPPAQALKATNGWGGDAYVAFEKDGKTCVSLAWKGDTDTDRQEMRDALDAWAAAMPAGSAKISDDSDLLRVDSCDPGQGADITINDRSLDALQVIGVRSYLTLSAVQDGGLSVDDAFNYGECVVERVPFDVLVQSNMSDQTPPQSFFDALDACRK
jgi:hypothetical protein